jgi:hypothetical protein
LTFARPIAGWAWVLVVGGLFGLSWLSYWRLESSRRVRVLLAGIRGFSLVLLVVLACGPQLRRDNERTEEDWLVVMLDRSGSMLLPDAGQIGQRVSRDESLREVLDSAGEVLERIAEGKRVMWLGFDSGVFDVDPGNLSAPAGRTTALGASLRSALDRVAGRPISGVLILSDGRSMDRPDRDVLRMLERRQVPVFTVGLGSAEPIADVAVRRVQAPSVVFAEDVLTAQVELERLGGADDGGGAAELVDLVTGEVLDRREVEFDVDGRESVVLSSRVGDVGSRRLAVRFVGSGEDLISENNAVEFAVEFVDRPLRVLYLDGYPRWEQRYLKGLILRERSVLSSSLLIAASRRFEQEGDIEIATLPETVEEWAEFDVVVIGDLRPELLGERALEQLREHIADRGAGLIWLGGAGATPWAWRGSALEDLLPMRLESEGSVTVFDEPVTMNRSEAAAALGLFALEQAGEYGAMEPGWPTMLSDPGTGWSRLWWAQRIREDSVKPGAVVLGSLTPESMWRAGGDGASWPGVLMMRFGAGTSVYVATDEVWRWRYGRGEDLSERFWVPLMRQLGRASLERGGRSVLLRATPEEATVGQGVRVVVELLDQSLIDVRAGGVGVEVVGTDGVGAGLRLMPEADGRGRFFSGVWTPTEPGRFVVRVDDALLGSIDGERVVRVGWPDDESRWPETDFELLASLSQASGGRVLDVSEFGELEELLPNREVKIAGEPEIVTLWDRGVVLVVFLSLFGFEWVGRRLVRLA